MQEEHAVKTIQCLVRKWLAWKKLLSKMNSVYEKEYDPDTNAWFYVNKVNRTLRAAQSMAAIGGCTHFLVVYQWSARTSFFLGKIRTKQGVYEPSQGVGIPN